jgi:hypothetical protein
MIYASIVQATVAADITLFKIINTHHTAFLDGFFLFVSSPGNGWMVIPPLFALILWRTPTGCPSRGMSRKHYRGYHLARRRHFFTGNAFIKKL